MMKEMLGNSYLFGGNAPFIEELYESYLKDPAAVEPRWRDYFDELQRLDQGAADVAHTTSRSASRSSRKGAAPPAPAVVINRPQLGEKQVAVLQLITAYRFQGVRHADIDPLKRQREAAHPRARPGVLRPDRGGHGHGVQHRHAGRAAGR